MEPSIGTKQNLRNRPRFNQTHQVVTTVGNSEIKTHRPKVQTFLRGLIVVIITGFSSLLTYYLIAMDLPNKLNTEKSDKEVNKSLLLDVLKRIESTEPSKIVNTPNRHANVIEGENNPPIHPPVAISNAVPPIK